MNKKITAILLAAGMAVSMAGCGSSSSTSAASSASSSAASASAAASASTSSSASTETAASTSSAASETVASTSGEGYGDFTTVTAGELHMATNAAFPPYESTDGNGNYTGIDVDIATEIANKLGLKLVVDDMEFSSVITSVQGGKEDIAMAGLTDTPEREQNVNFTDSYATGVQSIIVKEDSDIKSADDLGNASAIGCQEGTTGYIYCSESEEDGGYGDKAISYPNGATAVQALQQGKVDAVVIDNAPAQEFVKANEGLKILDTPYVEEQYAIGVNKKNEGLLNAVNKALNELIDDGTVQSILDKYINTDTGSDSVSSSSAQ
ncbi:MAG: ABC transporter substrate-binding protein [Lachnospiraceae bacterium]|jgi:ABC-type amino acid transport substrate-binding protein|nr:ABC transporter substrate-binding protein [Lachnospiraceae bacterium]